MKYNRAVFEDLAVNRKQTFCLLGDSILAFHTITNAYSNALWSQGIFNWALNKLGWPLELVNNGASGGLTSTQILARFDTQVSPYAPGYLFYNGGINDSGAELTAAQTVVNLQKIAQACYTAGIYPVFCGIHATNAFTSVAGRNFVSYVNQTMKDYFDKNLGTFLDLFTYTLDFTTGNALTKYTYDGTHFSTFGAKAVGESIVYDTLNKLLISEAPIVNSNDWYNLIPNPTLQGSNASGTNGFTITGGTFASGQGPNMWTADGTNINAVTSTLTNPTTRSDGRPGILWRMNPVMSADNGYGRLSHTVRWDSVRANNQAYTLGQWVIPTVSNGFMYVCVTAGTSHSSEPAFTTTIGNTTAEGSGTVVWRCYAIPQVGDTYQAEFELASVAVTSDNGMPSPIIHCLDSGASTLFTVYGNYWDSHQAGEVLPTALSTNYKMKTRKFTIPTGCTRLFLQVHMIGANTSQLVCGLNMVNLRKINV